MGFAGRPTLEQLLASSLVLFAVAGCSGGGDGPTGPDTPSARSKPILQLAPGDPNPPTGVLREVLITVPATGSAQGQVELFGLGEIADTAHLEGFSELTLANGAFYPFSRIAATGRQIYYLPDGSLMERTIQLTYFQTRADGAEFEEDLSGGFFETTDGVTRVESANPARWRDVDAGIHSSRIMYSISEPTNLGTNANDPNFFAGCVAILHPEIGCIEGPGFGPDAISTTGLAGVLRIRVLTGGPTLRVECTPDEVTRTEEVSCQAIAARPDSFQVTKWQFRADSMKVKDLIEEEGPATTWSGPMVVSGVVTVQAQVGGESRSAADTIRVRPRNWSSKRAQWIHLQALHEYSL